MERVYLGNRRFLVNAVDLENGRIVRRIVDERRRARTTGTPPPRLVSFRQEFRRIAAQQRIAGLIDCLERSNPELLLVTIWLVARTRSSIAISAIAPYRYHKSDRVRREAARGLRRLGAWAELRRIAHYDFDDRVRRLATAPEPKPFDRRFARFAGQASAATATDAGSRPFPLFVQQPVGPRRLAKTPEFIRAILQRIQQLVRGH